VYSYRTKSRPSAVGRPVEVGFWAYETVDAHSPPCGGGEDMVVSLVGSSVDMRPLRVRVPAFTGSYLPAVLRITESRTVYL
jgi:hypothetical protein